VLRGIERIDADRHTAHTAFDHLLDDPVGDQDAVRAITTQIPRLDATSAIS